MVAPGYHHHHQPTNERNQVTQPIVETKTPTSVEMTVVELASCFSVSDTFRITLSNKQEVPYAEWHSRRTSSTIFKSTSEAILKLADEHREDDDAEGFLDDVYSCPEWPKKGNPKVTHAQHKRLIDALVAFVNATAACLHNDEHPDPDVYGRVLLRRES